MGTTQPIKRREEIQKLEEYFYSKGEFRNYAMIVMGVNTAVRISDLLNLKWENVWNFQQNRFKDRIIIIEKKTGKMTNVYLNNQCRKCLGVLMQRDTVYAREYIFKSRVGENRPIGRNRAYVIIREACRNLGYEGILGCHSLRKTFGYHAWKQGISPAVIMAIYNHSSMEITQRYLSIEQDEKDEVYKTIMF